MGSYFATNQKIVLINVDQCIIGDIVLVVGIKLKKNNYPIRYYKNYTEFKGKFGSQKNEAVLVKITKGVIDLLNWIGNFEQFCQKGRILRQFESLMWNAVKCTFT